MPKISVIVPVYNAVEFIHRCIDSILAQTFDDFELLLINDGSKDNSGVICDEYAEKDSRVRVFHKKNEGPSSARNLGLYYAKGDWVTFCDSDDWVYREWLYNFALNVDSVDIVCSGIRFDKSSMGCQILKDKGFDYKGNQIELLDKMYFDDVVGYTVIKCFKKSIIDKYKLKFSEKFNIHEDEEFIMRYLVHCSSVCAVKNIGYHYMMPDFEKKYKSVQNGYELYKSLYTNCQIINNNNENVLGDKYINEMTEFFILDFKKTKYNKRRELLTDYKLVAGSNISRTRLFFFTKWLLRIDFTRYVSTLFLTLYFFIKERFYA